MIILKTPEEIDRMRRSNKIVAEVHELLKEMIKPGISTMDLERVAEEETLKRGAIPAFKGYSGYPYCLCTSLNNEVVHGMPSDKKILKDGDILSVDFGVQLDGFFGDAAITHPVGRITDEADRLLKVTEESLNRAIEATVIGNRLNDISYAVQSYVEGEGFSVVKDFVGHGIGRSLHEAPQVPNFGNPGMGPRLKAGMVLAIEPMINMGGCGVKVLNDGWTAITIDGSLSAHFEHSIAITDSGPYVLSRL